MLRARVDSLLALVALFVRLCPHTHGYNLDVNHYIALTGPTGSLFGYSVLLHKHRQDTWVLVGAPRAASKFDSSAKNPGAIYKCKVTNKGSCQQIHLDNKNNISCGRTCLSETENQWLGVSLSRERSSGGILACGHRWKNIYYAKKENKLPNGICFQLEADLIQSRSFTPCYKDHQRKFGEDYGSCQAGISNFLTKDLVVMGAPGTSYWTGSVLVHNTSSKVMAAFVDEESTVLFGSYLGYSVGAGHFSHTDTTEVVGGAPQHGQTGKAYVFKVESNRLNIIFEAKGNKLGSYFGASVCAVDLNSDGLSDLLVGAPMFSTVREEGRVHVYINQGSANLKEVEFELVGSDSYAARFGETIVDLGDIDDDGFPDVAIGAPQEEDLQGAIYIYNGRKSGISKTFSQRITGTVLGKPFQMFGQSVYGGIDVDGNGFPDVAVGAFLSDTAVVLRTRPVVIVEASVLLPLSVNRSVPLCVENGQPAVCLNVSVCFTLRGRNLPGHIGMLYNLTADVDHRESFPSRFYFTGNGTSNTTTGRVSVQQAACFTHQAYMRKDVRDIFTPIRFQLRYELGKHNVAKTGSSGFPLLKPILQQSEDSNRLVSNETKFARFCAWPNCSTNLQVSARLGLPHSYKNQPYFALGSGKTMMLNVKLVNAGDDAFLPTLRLRFPPNLYFIKVLDSEENFVSCENFEEEKIALGLDCNVGNIFMKSFAKLNISFLLDVNQNSSVGDLKITVNATCDNHENVELLYDNVASVMLPLRYAVDLNVHGAVSPTTFMLGHKENDGCFSEKFNYTYKVINVGPSKAPGTRVEIDIPLALAPYPYRLLHVIDLQTSLGHCYIKNSTVEINDNCAVAKPNLIEELVFYFSKTTKRQMYCMKDDPLCLYVVCEFGAMDVGKEATIQMEVELNPAVLQISPGRHAVMLLESVALALPKRHPHILSLQEIPFTKVVLEALYDQQPPEGVLKFLIAVSLALGLVILALLVVVLWKAGFFKREFKEKQEAFQRDSWDFVQKTKSSY